ncbi:recombination protein RecT [Tissierella praeacuta]|uniref:recombinase RecT n=1 Tax=Tissierella praeacuta TaxID=43131 RepID=UPI0010438C35|nr:recombinase RecT [Tissierella praeacuta]TCU72905.1 recombination protein RecT [Tissierella praeacuta]
MSNNQVAVQNQDLSLSQRFTNAMIQEFQSGVGAVALTDFQQRLAQNYFIAIDAALKTAEINRQRKKTNKDPLPVTWQNVDMNLLARNLVSYARIGLDPAQKNHIHAMPFKNNSTNKYDIVFIEGYRGIELKAQKYGLDVPDAVIFELVYSNDHFKPIKKSRTNKIEDYEFEITNAFNRGEIVGGFYYHLYNENPSKNKLVIMTIDDILKRKPKYASAEFWGGEKDVWKNGQVVGKEKIEGWYEQMCYKTIFRAAYNDITIDSQKIDDDYLRLKQLENQATENMVHAEIEEHANTQMLDFDEDTGEIIEVEGQEVEETEEVDEEPEQIEMEGPGY